MLNICKRRLSYLPFPTNTNFLHYFIFQSKTVLNSLYRSYSNVAPTTKLFINGNFQDSKTKEWIDLHNPATNEVVTRVPETTTEEMVAAVNSAKEAFTSWRRTSVLTRQQLMLKLQSVLRRDLKKIAANITEEQGKTLADAEGDVMRGLRKYSKSTVSIMIWFGLQRLSSTAVRQALC